MPATTNYGVMLMAVAIVAALCCCCQPPLADASPMLYKKNPHDKYEADLVPVSSTVIPLSVLEVSYGLGGKPSEEYKQAYLKKLRKKVVQRQQHPGAVPKGEPDAELGNADTLITVTGHRQEDSSQATIKSIQH